MIPETTDRNNNQLQIYESSTCYHHSDSQGPKNHKNPIFFKKIHLQFRDRNLKREKIYFVHVDNTYKSLTHIIFQQVVINKKEKKIFTHEIFQ